MCLNINHSHQCGVKKAIRWKFLKKAGNIFVSPSHRGCNFLWFKDKINKAFISDLNPQTGFHVCLTKSDCKSMMSAWIKEGAKDLAIVKVEVTGFRGRGTITNCVGGDGMTGEIWSEAKILQVYNTKKA